MVYHRKLSIILDMDGTLIASTGTSSPPKPRPYLKPFLRFCFENYRFVGIWTAANAAWYDHVNEKVFAPILKSLGKKFSFVYVDTKVRTTGGERTKPLQNIWKRTTGVFTHFTPTNTIIVDDTRSVCALNKSSCMIVPKYAGKDTDKVLKLLARDMRTMIAAYQHVGDVRKVIPTCWK